jgi:NADPH2:quinone reductase
LIDFSAEKPIPTGRDLCVAVRAVSVNPIDTKMRMRATPGEGAPPKILGYDAAGVVDTIGPEATLFKPGDEVYYAGAIQRPGTNSEYHLVDERIVGRKPRSLSFAQSAAMPLTAITAWELLFDRLGVKRGDVSERRSLLVVGGAGGVGSILIQLARRLTSLTVIATASRQQTHEWCLKLGAHHVINYTRPFADELKAAGHGQIDLVAGLTMTEQHYPQFAPLIAPQGKFALIDDAQKLDIYLLRPKSISIHWESMFTRSLFGTADMIEQHNLLDAVSKLADDDTIITTMTQTITPINAANLRKVHAQIESNTSIGKTVLEGW